MMIAVDTNVLVYAHRRHLPQHGRALEWLTCLAEGPVPWAIPVFCLGEFVRVVTHARIFDPPSTLPQALSTLEGLLQCPTLRVLNPGPRYPALFDETARSADARGNLAFDAQIAAVCQEQGVSRLLTLDRDFARFPRIEILTLDVSPQTMLR
jgi:toxin-antitoxin system PIN domain toxin